MNVGWACVGVATSVGRMISVGVERSSNIGRTMRLIVPAQYIASAPMTIIARQP
jgi:hypothetical protein